MGEKDRQVNRPEPSRIDEAGMRPALETLHLEMVSQVARQEQCGGDQGTDHAVAMSGRVAPLDVEEPCREEDCTRGVEAGVDDGKIGVT